MDSNIPLDVLTIMNLEPIYLSCSFEVFSLKVGLTFWLLISSCWVFALSFCNTFLASQHTKARKAPLHALLETET